MFLAALTPLLTFAAFLLLLLVSLSVPIIKDIYLFKLTANVDGLLGASAKSSAKFGVWGYCYSGVSASFAGIGGSTDGGCTKAHLGYKIDDTVASILHIEDYTNLISKTLTAVLVLHPIACGLAFLAFVLSLLMMRRTAGTTRGSALATMLSSLLAALVTTVIFLIDVILVAVVRHRVHKRTDGVVSLNWGNAVWMALGATVALWLAILGACCGLFQIRRARRMSGARNPNTY